jgi:hypothetical protein
MHGSYGHDRIGGKAVRNRTGESRDGGGTRVCDSTRDKDVALREPREWKAARSLLLICYAEAIAEGCKVPDFRVCGTKAMFRCRIFPQILLCKKKIPHHIKMSAQVWSTKCR